MNIAARELSLAILPLIAFINLGWFALIYHISSEHCCMEFGFLLFILLEREMRSSCTQDI